MWWVGIAMAAAPEVGVRATFDGLAAELARTLVLVNGRAEGARCRLEIHGAPGVLARYEGAVQAAATAGVEARMTGTEIRLDRASVPARPELETHVFPFDGDPAVLDRVWSAAGADAIVSTATGGLIVTVHAERAAAAVAAVPVDRPPTSAEIEVRP